jgi:large subunit ribosomal protein L3
MKFIIGKKLDMTQIWQGDKAVAVTRVQAGPCYVTQIKKNSTKDKYNAVQLGYGERKEKNIKKPQQGHLAKMKSVSPDSKTNLRYMKEFRAEAPELKVGDMIDVSTFAIGDNVKVTGTSKGKGFQGVMRRHHFAGHKTTHGNKDQQRMPGSIGAKGPAHVMKGTRMGGRMGGGQVTVANLEIAGIDEANNILMITGAVPGARNSVLYIKGEGELKVRSAQTEEKAPEAEVAPVEEAQAAEAQNDNLNNEK